MTTHGVGLHAEGVRDLALFCRAGCARGAVFLIERHFLPSKDCRTLHAQRGVVKQLDVIGKDDSTRPVFSRVRASRVAVHTPNRGLIQAVALQVPLLTRPFRS